MFALIKNKKVVDTSNEVFPIHPFFEWIKCDESIEAGDSYENKVFSKQEKSIIEQMPTIQEQITALYEKFDGNDEKFLAIKNKLQV